ncbi:hypothetical protein QUF70_03265 [Desulfobacterales bacterium HSG17]|nr:hypothetical protein [Desulfobacterales bacterium HSG17]
MGSFKDIGDSESVNSKYSGRAIIYLESKEDYQIFSKRWFYDQGEFLEFRPSDIGSGGGCTNVIKDVENDREKNIPSFGIVDRDALMQQHKWKEFWETDDSKYKEYRPFGENIRPLCRWEIENYLFDIDEIEHLLADIGKGSPRETRKKSIVIKELIIHCDVLIPIMAYNVSRHINGQDALPVAYCVNETIRIYSEKIIKEKIDKEEKEIYEDIISKIENFKFNSDEITEESFYKINRIIDGKRLFERLKNHNRLTDDYRFLLARRIKENGNIDSELLEMIEEFKGLN